MNDVAITPPVDPGLAFLSGDTELAKLFQAKDWSATPLGPARSWPQSLKTAVGIVLRSDFPMVVLWGPELIQLYNDRYRLIMGAKHPAGLGQGNRACWPEAWHINESIYPRVFAGETISFREAVYPLAPHGVVQDHYLTLSYSPVHGESGNVGGVFVTVFDVTREVRTRVERDVAVAEARAERARLYEVFMQAPAAIAVVEGADDVFTVANARYRELAGRDVMGKRLRAAFPELEGQGFFELFDQVRATGIPFLAHDAPAKIDRGRGIEEIFVDFVYQPLAGLDGKVFGVMIHAVDTTEHVRLRADIERRNAELQRLAHALAETNRELDQFAYVASHDLKAPLRGISNLAEWVQDDLGEHLSGESRQHLTLLKSRVHRMEALIEGILAYSRAGRVRVAVETIDTGALLREVIDLIAPPAGFVVDVQEGMPTLSGERVPLQQVFLNLIANAVKFTRPTRPDGRVTVTFTEIDDAWRFAVEDNGPGIAPAFHERVWTIFQTLESRDKVEGTGIGLSVVRKIVEARGGRVELTSSQGNGATFAFTWKKTPPPVAGE